MMIAATLKLGKTPCMVGAANYEDCTQPPGILTWAAMSLYNVAQDVSFLKDAYRAFSRNNDALYAERAEARPALPRVPLSARLYGERGVLNGYSSTRVSLWVSLMFGNVAVGFANVRASRYGIR